MSDQSIAKPVSSIFRILQIRKVFKKYALYQLVEPLQLPYPAKIFAGFALGRVKKHPLPIGERVRLALEELGPVFVKLGQALSTRPDLLPADIAQELALLQDKVAPIPAEQSMQIIRNAYGDDLNDIFTNIDVQPLASASVAQVHSATLREGLAIEGQNRTTTDEVIIKVIRPGIEAIIKSDLRVMYRFARFLQTHWSRGAQFRPLDVINEYENTILDELDLRIEAANGARMGADFEQSDLIYLPRIYWDYTTENVLVMEKISGVSIRELETLKTQGVDFKKLSEDAVGIFFRQAFDYNFFHADMHAGNIFVSDKGQWIAIDFGIMGTLEKADQRYLGEILLGFFNRDYWAITQTHIRSGWVPKGTKATEFEQAIRVVCEPIFAKPLSEISFGKVLMQLFQTVRRFEMPVQPQLVLLYKTLLNIEGLGRQLYPDLNLWETAKPFLEQWMKRQYSPQTLLEELKRDLPAWQSALRQLPTAIETATKPRSNKQIKVASKRPILLGLTAISLATALANYYGLINLETFGSAPIWAAFTCLILAWGRSEF
ncbi:MAG: 2-polyprenylphenol 6-hydroxylase [Gammaproteobacteria bacterium]|nr:2-polyprenylphenol 6-hydroxylase [Gammaproteobacteria bacterium]